MITSRYCLDQSAHCAHEARATSSTREREVLFSMARAWETLAKHAARFELLKATAAPEGDDPKPPDGTTP